MTDSRLKAQVLRIATARINHKAASDERVLDITRKSANEEAGRLMAPEWRMVLDFKEDRIDWPTYTRQYQDLLRKRYARYAQVFHDLIRDAIDEDKRLVLTCYCNTGSDSRECHRFLMADILGKIARQRGYEASREGDLSRHMVPETSPQLALGI
ncbi:MAG: hypothetical protein J4G17_00600 [Anaerolineae bacterium]|nr:hypothetical protein [Anaerolineae bacterium]